MDATWRQLQRLYDMLPVTVPTRACQDQTGSSPDSGSSFTVGGYSHASFHGLRRYTKKYPWTGALLASIVRSIHPAHRFTTISLINNVQSLMHTDSHNDEDTCNLILPFSTFSEGGLWIENPRGSVRLDTSGPAGIVHETSVPLLFEPRRKHATFPWSGRRCCLVAFHVRQAHRIPRAEMQVLLQLRHSRQTESEAQPAHMLSREIWHAWRQGQRSSGINFSLGRKVWMRNRLL